MFTILQRSIELFLYISLYIVHFYFIHCVLYKLYRTFTLVEQLKTWCSFNSYYCISNSQLIFLYYITYYKPNL